MSAAAQPTLAHLLGGWNLDPLSTALLVLGAALYGLGIVRLGTRRPSGRARRSWSAWRATSFFAGLVTTAFALDSGLDRIGERELLSVHTVQHLLLALIAPALLLLGAPVRLALAAGSRPLRAGLAAVLSSAPVRVLARPVVGCALFAAVMLVTHLRAVYELALEDPTFHVCEHAAYFFSGLLLLAPLIAADPLPRPPGALARFSWLMAAMTAMAIPGALLTFAASVSYPFYLAPAHALGRSALADEHLAGVIMWVGGGVVMFALALLLAFVAMLDEERRQRRRELYMPDDAADAWRAEAMPL